MVYGAMCTWWDYIENAGTKDSGLPCCPRCGSVLFQEYADKWFENVRKYAEELKDPDYERFVRWNQGKCFPTVKRARVFYDKEKPRVPSDRITAGELRAVGWPIPPNIPDVATIPRSALRLTVGEAMEKEDGGIVINMVCHLDAKFEWISVTVVIPKD